MSVFSLLLPPHSTSTMSVAISFCSASYMLSTGPVAGPLMPYPEPRSQSTRKFLQWKGRVHSTSSRRLSECSVGNVSASWRSRWSADGYAFYAYLRIHCSYNFGKASTNVELVYYWFNVEIGSKSGNQCNNMKKGFLDQFLLKGKVTLPGCLSPCWIRRPCRPSFNCAL